jgi:hypothetical protein
VTIGDLIEAALQDLGVLAAGQTMPAEDAALALARCNDWIDALATERLTIYTISRTTWAIVAGTASYAVSNPPVTPTGITIKFLDTSADPDLEIALGQLTDAQYAAIPQKALASPYPQQAYYNPTWPNGTITLWPVPTSSTLQGVIYAPTTLSEFTGLSDTVDLPRGYRRFLRTNLVVEIASAFNAPVTARQEQQAREAKAAIKRANIRLHDLSLDTPFTGGGTYDITADA